MATNGKEVAGQILSPAMQRPLIEGAEAPPKKCLVEKLAEACDAVGGIEKKGKNTQQGYDYVKAADVAKAIRHELFSRGIIIVPSEGELIQERIETMKGGFMTEIRLKMTFNITDGTENLPFDAWGVARDSGDKAVYKAKTGAGKYFLRALGLIPDEKDDPEADETVDDPKNAPRSTPVERKAPASQSADTALIADFQKNAFLSAAKKSGKTNQEVNNFLGSLGVEELSELPKKNFPEALKWAMEAA